MRLDLTLHEAETLRHCLTQALTLHERDVDGQVLKAPQGAPRVGEQTKEVAREYGLTAAG